MMRLNVFFVSALFLFCSCPVFSQNNNGRGEYGFRSGMFFGLGKIEGASVYSGDLTLGKHLDSNIYLGGSLGVIHQLGSDYPVIPLTFDFRYLFDGHGKTVCPFWEFRPGFAYDTAYDISGLYEFGYFVWNTVLGAEFKLGRGIKLATGAGYMVMVPFSGSPAIHQLGFNIRLGLPFGKAI